MIKKKEYKDKKGLRHAFTENLKDFRRKCKKTIAKQNANDDIKIHSFHKENLNKTFLR